jgi:hypothetical protein
MPVPNTFANATTSIPLSQLDQNFATAITLGNTAIQLGNTVTTLNNMTLANVTVSSGNVTVTSVSGAFNGTVGATTPNTGAFTTVSANNTVTLAAPSNAIALQVRGRSSDNLSATYYYANNGTTLHAQTSVSASEFRTTAEGTSVQTWYTGSSERTRLDASGNFTVTSVALLGYGTGAGGTVTQATSKSTGVTLNKPCGTITMNNAALAAGALVTFGLINSLIGVNDQVLVTMQTASGSTSSYSVYATAGVGGANINLKNESGGSLSEALVLNFMVLKGATS